MILLGYLKSLGKGEYKNIMRSMGYVYVYSIYIYIQPFGNPTQLDNLYPPDPSRNDELCAMEAMAY